MLEYLHVTDDLSISNNPNKYSELLSTIYSGKCILVAGSALFPLQIDTDNGGHHPFDLRNLLERMVEWCVKEGIIHQYDTIEGFRKLLRRSLLAQARFRLQEYLVDKSQQQECLQECLKEVLLPDQAQIGEIHRLLAQIPFRGYITTTTCDTFDTFIETAFSTVRQGQLTKFYKSSIQDAIEAYQNEQPFILKLQNEIDNPDPAAVGHSISNELSIIDNRDQLQQLFSELSVLFIGFKRKEPDLGTLKDLLENVENFQNRRIHWMLVPDGQLSKNETEELWNSKRIKTISYWANKGHFGLVTLLETLVQPRAISVRNFQASQSPGYSYQSQPLPAPTVQGFPRSIEIFMAYARQDGGLLQKIEQQLTILRLQNLNIHWYDSDITAGTEWELENEENMNKADVILLLISNDFLASQYCYGVQVQKAVQRHNNREACVIPIILHPCIWDRTPFAKLQSLPKDGKPISKWSNKHDAFLSIGLGIRKAVESLQYRLWGNI